LGEAIPNAQPLAANARWAARSPRYLTSGAVGTLRLHFNRIALGRASARPALLHRNRIRGEPRGNRHERFRYGPVDNRDAPIAHSKQRGALLKPEPCEINIEMT